MYTHQSIESVREADIVLTIQRYVADLKKAGSSYEAKSPFVQEKTASFKVSPVKQIFKDFASGIGGDGIKFVMEYEKCDFIEAVEKIAAIHNIFLQKDDQNLSPEDKRKKKQKSDALGLVANVASRYRKNFIELPADHWAKTMVTERGFSEETLIDFQIGFAQNDNQVTTAVSAVGKLSQALEIGLSKSDKQASYDAFRNRLIFPIHNHKGNVIGFGGRRSNDEEVEKYPKYINSAESELYNKSEVLYGLFQAKKSISTQGWAVLTEGYTDVMGLYDKGADNAVATCGTALTEQHIKLLHKYTDHIVLMRDGDRAGITASKRDLEIALREGMRVSICPLLDGKDPDDMAREVENIQDYIWLNKKDALLWYVEDAVEKFLPDNYKFDVEQLENELQQNIASLESNLIDVNSKEKSERKDAEKHNKGINASIELVKKESEKLIAELPKVDAYKKEHGINEIVKLLVLIQKEVTLKEYARQISKMVEIPLKTLESAVANMALAQKEKAKKTKDKNEKPFGFPEGASTEQYFADRFCEVGNTYHFEQKGGFFVGTNFRLIPLYHIKGQKENKRLCEVVNIENKRDLIDFESESFVSYADFRKQLIRVGYYIFLSGTNTTHFDLVSQKVLKQFNTALELQSMGWNSKGFFAFANGVYWKGAFQNVNNYGIMYLDGIAENEEDDGYNEKVEYYYSPAFSVIHRKNQEGDDPYENDRKFVYKQSAITLAQWMTQMYKVFQEKAMVGIVFNFAALFRDLFLKKLDFFPLLGGFGEKDSGKSGFGKALQNFFFFQEEPMELNQATLVGLNRRLSRTTNTVTFLDEYTDKLDERIIQALKGAWNGLGREKGIATTDKRTVVDKINQAIYYAGQYIPVSDDNALQTRTICLQFPNKNYTTEEKEEFNKLIAWTSQGISSLIIDIVDQRSYFESRLITTYNEVIREVKIKMNGKDTQERIFGNISVLLITYKILQDKINFPFTYDEFLAICIELLVDNTDSVTDSNGLTEFWKIFQFLYESKINRTPEDFRVEQISTIKLLGNDDVKIDYVNSKGSRLLMFRMGSIHQNYDRECSRRGGIDAIGETTIRNYFKSRPYFLGRSNQRFGSLGVQSCYVFDYDMMKDKNILVLVDDNDDGLKDAFSEFIQTTSISHNSDKNEGLPF